MKRTLILTILSLSLSYAVHGSTLGVNASDYKRANWVEDINAASLQLGAAGGTIIVSDDLAATDGSGTVGQLGDHVNLEFTGSGVFTSCTINAGKYSKITSADAQLKLKGSGCIGINEANTVPLQGTDGFAIRGLRVDCDGQPSATGVYVANHARTYIDHLDVANCTDPSSSLSNPTGALVFNGTQFAEVNGARLYNDYVGVKLYSVPSSGGGNSNTFINLQVNIVTVGLIQVAEGPTYWQGSNVCQNCNFTDSALAGVALIGVGGVHTTLSLDHGTTEQSALSLPSAMIDGFVIKAAALYADTNATFYLDQLVNNDAHLSPWAILLNGSTLVLHDVTGYGNSSGVIASTDATSTVVTEGATTFVAGANVIAGTGQLVSK